jgi:hypothetical protein
MRYRINSHRANKQGQQNRLILTLAGLHFPTGTVAKLKREMVPSPHRPSETIILRFFGFGDEALQNLKVACRPSHRAGESARKRNASKTGRTR